MLSYSILRVSGVQEAGGSLKYKTADGFERFQLWGKKETEISKAYDAGDTIILYDEGVVIAKYKNVPTVYADKWDNYESNDTRRMNAINDVLELLKKYTTVAVSFDYEGRTRHETASEVFKNTLQRLGYDDLEFEIGYNYHFRITRKAGEFNIK